MLDYFHEDTDLLAGANVYNGQNSVLWCNFRDAFPDEIKATYQDLRSNSVLNYDELIDQFITKGSDKWSESIYNEDADFKYISMLYTDGDASNLGQVRGTGEEHFRYFIENRLNYCDGKWYASDYADDYVALRIYTPSTWAGVEPNADITVTPYSHMYAGVRYKANGTLYQKRVSANEVTTFEAPNETFNDTETAIYGASQLSSLGDLSPLYCGSINVSKAEKLTELIIGSDAEGYSNPNLNDLSVGTNNLLKVLNVRNCSSLTDPLALSGCPNIEEIYAAGSGITGIELANSGYLKTIELPATITNLSLKNQLYIETLTLEGYEAIKTINIENCPTIDGLDILSKATNVERVRLTNVNWTYDTAADVLALADRNLAGIDENGANIDYMWIDGTCHIKTLTGAEYLEVKEAFPYMTITYDTLTAQLIFMSEDGNTELTRQTIQNGGNGTDPVTAGTITRPTKESTAQYHFTYAGWSLTSGGVADADALKNVEADRRVYVAFSKELRSYTVKFYNGTTLLQTSTVQYGGDAVYSGSTPVNNSTGNPDDFEFYGWNPAPTNIQGDTSCYAQFHDLREITDDWATIAANVANGTATSKYSIGAFKTLDIGAVELPYDFSESSAVVYNNEIHILGSFTKSYRTSHYKYDGSTWTSVSTLPHVFYRGSAVVYNNEIHILGGYGKITAHHKWDGSTWTSVSTLPYSFYNSQAIVYNNEIHILGGYGKTTGHYKWDGSTWISVSTLPYDLQSGAVIAYNDEIHIFYETKHYKWDGSTWTSVSTLPYAFYNSQVIVHDNEIHMLGSSSASAYHKSHYKWNGTEWVSVSVLPYEFYKGSAVIYNNEIHIMGSDKSSYKTAFYSYSSETSKWSKYVTESIPMQIVAHNHDELADDYKWDSVGELPHYFYRGACVNLNGEIHILGSGNANHNKKHYKYDGTSWTSVSTLPYGFYYSSAVVYNDEIHILGGNGVDTNHYKWNGAEWVSVSTLPYNFYRGIAVVFNNEIHIMGSANTQYRLTHYKWDGSAWTSVGAPPYGVQDTAAVVLNNEIHILGSYMDGSETAHYKYDGSTWTEVSTLPYTFYRGAAVVLNNEIHIVGSNNSTEDGMKHYKWDGSTWTEGLQLPTQFYEGCAIVYDGKLTLVGNYANSAYRFFKQLTGPSWEKSETGLVGYERPYATCNNKIYYISSNIYEYDGETWTNLGSAPYNACLASAIEYNNELHLLGGSNNPTTHHKWNGTEWVSVSTLPYEFYQGCAVVYNNEIHMLGSSAGSTCFKSHYKWNGSEWVSVSTLPYELKYNGNAIVYNNELHIIGGNSTNHYKYDAATSSWVSVSTFPHRIMEAGCVVYDGKIHMLGGYSYTVNAAIDSHYVFNGTEWIESTLLPFAMRKHGAVVFRGHMCCLGGMNSGIGTMHTLRNPRATLTFLAGNVMKDGRPFNLTNKQYENYNWPNSGGWSLSELREYCSNELYNSFPSDLKDAIKEVNKLSDAGCYGWKFKSIKTIDKVWIPSLAEVDTAGNTDDTKNNGVSVYPVFTNNESRRRYKVGEDTGSTWWLRSAFVGNTNSFWAIADKDTVTGTPGIQNAYDSKLELGVLPGFCI